MLNVTISIGSWSANSGPGAVADSTKCLWYLEGIDGWTGSSPNVRSNLVARSSQDSLRGPRMLLGGREIMIVGNIIAPDEAELSRAMDRFRALLVTGDRRQFMTVTEHYRSLSRGALVELNGETLITRIGTCQAVWSLSLIAPDPVLYSGDIYSGTTGRYAPGSGFTFPVTHAYNHGTGASSGIININNPGNQVTWPTIRINGPLVNPVVRFVGGESLGLRTLVEGNQEIVFNTRDRLVTLGNASQRTRMTFDSRWFNLPAGNSQVHFDAADGTGTCTVEYRGAWA